MFLYFIRSFGSDVNEKAQNEKTEAIGKHLNTFWKGLPAKRPFEE